RQRAAARRPHRLGAPGEAGGTRVSDKPEIRERVWALLTARRVARFPLPLDERIPNFTGAERAAERLAETPEWKAATRLKCNPDAPQRPVRLRALSEGKLVSMAVPRPRGARSRSRRGSSGSSSPRHGSPRCPFSYGSGADGARLRAESIRGGAP